MVNRRKPGYKMTLQLSPEEMKEYGDFFKAMRQSIGLTQKQMGEEMGVFYTTIYRWETGQHIPNEDIDELERKYREVVKKYNGKEKADG